MKEILLDIVTSYYTWIAIELIVIGVLVFFVVKYSRIKKVVQKDIIQQSRIEQYQELDEMLINKKRSGR